MQNNVVGVLASGRGSNLQAIIEAINKGLLNVEIGVLISDKPNAKALDIATENNIIAICVDRKECSNQQEFEEKIVVALKKHNVIEDIEKISIEKIKYTVCYYTTRVNDYECTT